MKFKIKCELEIVVDKKGVYSSTKFKPESEIKDSKLILSVYAIKQRQKFLIDRSDVFSYKDDNESKSIIVFNKKFIFLKSTGEIYSQDLK
jgi:hypothetical protein